MQRKVPARRQRKEPALRQGKVTAGPLIPALALVLVTKALQSGSTLGDC